MWTKSRCADVKPRRFIGTMAIGSCRSIYTWLKRQTKRQTKIVFSDNACRLLWVIFQFFVVLSVAGLSCILAAHTHSITANRSSTVLIQAVNAIPLSSMQPNKSAPGTSVVVQYSPVTYLPIGLPLTSSFLLEYSSEYLNEYSSTRWYRKYFNTSCQLTRRGRWTGGFSF